jgi:hypothetical protein
VPVDAAAEATSQKRVVAFVGGRRMKDSDKKLIPDADNAEVRGVRTHAHSSRLS